MANTPQEAGQNGHRDFNMAPSFCNMMQQEKNHCLNRARKKTVEAMAPHVSHTGVHDHGFNNVSTYGNLLAFNA